MLPQTGYKQTEIKIEKNFTFRLDKPSIAALKKTISRYSKKPYEVTNGAEALRFMTKTFRILDDAGVFSDPVIQERFKELTANK